MWRWCEIRISGSINTALLAHSCVFACSLWPSSSHRERVEEWPQRLWRRKSLQCLFTPWPFTEDVCWPRSSPTRGHRLEHFLCWRGHYRIQSPPLLPKEVIPTEILPLLNFSLLVLILFSDWFFTHITTLQPHPVNCLLSRLSIPTRLNYALLFPDSSPSGLPSCERTSRRGPPLPALMSADLSLPL